MSSSRVSCRCLHRWLLPPTAAPIARPIHVGRGRKDAGPGVHFVSQGLLQLTVLQHSRRSHEPAAVCPECGCTLTFGAGRPHHTSATGAALASGSTSVDFKIATLVYLSLSGMAPAYLWPPTVSWSPTKVVVSCVLPHQKRAS